MVGSLQLEEEVKGAFLNIFNDNDIPEAELVTTDWSQGEQQREYSIFRLCKFPLLPDVEGDLRKDAPHHHPPPQHL